MENIKTILSSDDAVFRNNDNFRRASLKQHLPFWENEILKDHPHKQTLLKWLQGVQIEDFLHSLTTGSYHCIELNSFYPPSQHFANYVPEEVEQLMNEIVQDWINLGVLKRWNEVRNPQDPLTHWVVCPLGIEQIL